MSWKQWVVLATLAALASLGACMPDLDMSTDVSCTRDAVTSTSVVPQASLAGNNQQCENCHVNGAEGFTASTPECTRGLLPGDLRAQPVETGESCLNCHMADGMLPKFGKR